MLKDSTLIKMARILALAAILLPTSLWAQSLELVAHYDSLIFPIQTIIRGNIAYIADSGPGLIIFDISDPANPIRLGSYNDYFWVYRIDIQDTIALVGTGISEPYWGALDVVSIADPSHPYLLDTLDFDWEVVEVTAYGAFAYLSTFGSTQIVDISNPSDVRVLGTVPELNNAYRLVIDTYMFAARGGSISILDLDDPLNPELLGECPVPIAASDIATNSLIPDLIYAVDGDSGLQVIDISNPNAPYRVSQYDLPIWTRALAVDGTVAYVAGDSALYAIDISEPDNLVLIDSHLGLSQAADIECANGYIFVAQRGRVDVFRLIPDVIEHPYVPGDVNYNGSANGIDVTYAVGYFKGGNTPPFRCLCPGHDSLYAAGDVNGSCQFNGVDITYFTKFAIGGPPLRWCVDCPPVSNVLHDEIRGECQGEIPLDDSSYLVLEAVGDDLHIHQMDAVHQCCLEYHVEYSMRNFSITAMEYDTSPPCDCICPFDLESVVYNLTPGMYHVSLIDFDNEVVGIDSVYVGGR